jgi:hypothetical protein
MSKIQRSVVIIIVIIFGLYVLSGVVIDRINNLLYEYKIVKYGNEIDYLFNDKIKKDIYIKEVNHSGKRSTLYFGSVDSLSFLGIDATNFIGINPDKLNTQIVDKIDLTDWKSYTYIFHDGFPIIQAELNPKKSDYLRILLNGPYNIEYKEGTANHFYLSGKFTNIAFSNSQNCYIISFSGERQEILILKNNNGLFIITSETKKSLLEFINPGIL